VLSRRRGETILCTERKGILREGKKTVKGSSKTSNDKDLRAKKGKKKGKCGVPSREKDSSPEKGEKLSLSHNKGGKNFRKKKIGDSADTLKRRKGDVFARAKGSFEWGKVACRKERRDLMLPEKRGKIFSPRQRRRKRPGVKQTCC